jgi:hypothetical protein
MVDRNSLGGRQAPALVPPVQATKELPVEEFDERPWEQTGQVRRDVEPHRAPLLFWLGLLGVLWGAFSLLLVLPCLVGLPLSASVFLIAWRDLRAMRAGLMDSAGMKEIEQARGLALGGIMLSLAGVALGSVFLYLCRTF